MTLTVMGVTVAGRVLECSEQRTRIGFDEAAAQSSGLRDLLRRVMVKAA